MKVFEKILKPKNQQHLFLWGVVLFLLAGNNLFAQKSFSYSAGIGKYELTNIGIHWNCSTISSLSVFSGSNLGLNNSTEWATGITFNQVFRKPANWKLKLGYSLGTTFWTHNDDLYFFKTISFPLLIVLEYPVSKALKIRAEGGVVLSAVMQSDRKQNVTAGYPKRFDGDFGIKLIYNFNRNEE